MNFVTKRLLSGLSLAAGAAAAIAGIVHIIRNADWSFETDYDDPELELALHQSVLGRQFGRVLYPQAGDKMLYCLEIINHSDEAFFGAVRLTIPPLAESEVLDLGDGVRTAGNMIQYEIELMPGGHCEKTVLFRLPEMLDRPDWAVQADAVNDADELITVSNPVSCRFGQNGTVIDEDGEAAFP